MPLNFTTRSRAPEKGAFFCYEKLEKLKYDFLALKQKKNIEKSEGGFSDDKGV